MEWWTSEQSSAWSKLRHQKRYVYLWASAAGTGRWYYRYRTIILDEWEHAGLTKTAAQAMAAAYTGVPVDPIQSLTGTSIYGTADRVIADQWKVTKRQEVVSAWSNTGPMYAGGVYWLEYGSLTDGQH